MAVKADFFISPPYSVPPMSTIFLTKSTRMKTSLLVWSTSGKAWKPGQSMLWDLLSDDDRLLGERDGVVADICGVIVTAAGEVAMSDLSERIIAIGASALRRIPRRVAVVLGTDKTDALISALRSGLITDLVVEADAARALLKAG